MSGIAGIRQRVKAAGHALDYNVVFTMPVTGHFEDAETNFQITRAGSYTAGVLLDTVITLVEDHAQIHWDVAVAGDGEEALRRQFNGFTRLLDKFVLDDEFLLEKYIN